MCGFHPLLSQKFHMGLAYFIAMKKEYTLHICYKYWTCSKQDRFISVKSTPLLFLQSFMHFIPDSPFYFKMVLLLGNNKKVSVLSFMEEKKVKEILEEWLIFKKLFLEQEQII